MINRKPSDCHNIEIQTREAIKQLIKLPEIQVTNTFVGGSVLDEYYW
jgi:hypothetical protein|tara:strand:- start:128 stop:268 length:141 start_codon:yes stop_codon:yes gene_type:complete